MRGSLSFLPRLCGLLLCLILGVKALHESDVGVIDWHKQLVGVPLSGSIATAPTFLHARNKSLIITATGGNVLAALDSENGSVAWRYVYEPADRIAGFYKSKDFVASLSGPGGSTLRVFDSSSGDLLLEKRMHDPQSGSLSEPHFLGKSVAFGEDGDLYVLTNGYTLTRLDVKTGSEKWSWSSPDHSSLIIHSHAVLTSSAIYLVGIASSTASYTLHVTSLDPSTGALIHSANIPSSIAEPLRQYTLLQAADNTGSQVVWFEAGNLKSYALTPELKAKPATLKPIGQAYGGIFDVGLASQGQLVVLKQDGEARVVVLKNGALKEEWTFHGSAASDKTSESLYAGGVGEDGKPYLGRVYWSVDAAQAAAHIYAPHLPHAEELAKAIYLPFDSNSHGVISHVTISGSRLLLTSTTGSIQLWDTTSGSKEPEWAREESLAAVGVVEFVELPERAVVTSEIKKGEEGWGARVGRHITQLQNLPAYIVYFSKRFATGSYTTPTSVPADTSSAPGSVFRDPFGLRQLILVATLHGKLYALDSTTGTIVWSRVLGLGWALSVGGTVHPLKMFTIKSVSDGKGGEPEVILIAQRRAENSLMDTVVFHVNALTGEDLKSGSGTEGVLEGFDIIQGPVVEAFLLNHNDTHIAVMLDEFLQVHLYPETSETQHLFTSVAPQLSFPLRSNTAGQHRLAGHKVTFNTDVSDRYVAYPVWSKSLPAGEDIQTLIPTHKGPIASLGKVLGNRTTLYKYLNPRLFVLLTSPRPEIKDRTCGLYLIDSEKGTVVYNVQLPVLEGSPCEVKASLTENWLVYHYYDPGENVSGTSKGWRMVTAEFYEGRKVDEKIESSDMSSYNAELLNFSVYEQAYVFPHGITALSPTSTKFGITSKDLIVATQNNRIQTFQRRLLNPRRPSRKVTSEEQEEQLIPYDPVLPDNPRNVLSHNYEVANVQRIVTSPALLESTSLVFAYGLDMFLTRVAPSNTFDVLSENFNKAQLVLTVLGLAVAIIITRPMVQRKRLKEKWYSQ
ncbi:hypothetical protein BDQ17DRAFT_1407603 [Cyathus striatus]|nr:hypothetical protein BDQ17DRAFT_1407603 [Cyathus striatus]